MPAKLLHAAAHDRKARIGAVADLPAQFVGRIVEIEKLDLRARRHHRADPAVAEPQRHLDDRGLGLRDVAGRDPLAQHEADLLVGDRRRLAAHRNSRRIRSVVALKNHSSGAPSRAMPLIKRARAAAMRSGWISAIRFGTSSPRISDRYEIPITTTAMLIARGIGGPEPALLDQIALERARRASPRRACRTARR